MRRLWSIVLISMLGAFVRPAAAQVPTAEQLELLQSMSPEDRQALMEQLGLEGGLGGSTIRQALRPTPIALARRTLTVAQSAQGRPSSRIRSGPKIPC